MKPHLLSSLEDAETGSEGVSVCKRTRGDQFESELCWIWCSRGGRKWREVKMSESFVGRGGEMKKKKKKKKREKGDPQEFT